MAGSYEKKWKKEKLLGAGGQGEVHLVREQTADEQEVLKKIVDSLRQAQATNFADKLAQARKEFADSISSFVENRFHTRLGALKTLHSDDNARDARLAKERATKEIEAMKKWTHPNLLSLLDHDSKELWYVSEYHSEGPLDTHLDRYRGDLSGMLTAIRPLIEAVAQLHADRCVHRDIKPQNIFINSTNGLVLGDFGLVFVPDPQHTRISATHQNVGSRDWMPGWAMSKRVDELTPAFDVFALGKVMWSMLSGQPVLPLWYFDHEENNVAKLFPDSPHMTLANGLFAKCIVELESSCVPTAGDLLHEVDAVFTKIARGPSFFEGDKNCIVCRTGTYVAKADCDIKAVGSTFGLNPSGTYSYAIFTCDKCGHTQLFHMRPMSKPELWRSGRATLSGNKPLKS